MAAKKRSGKKSIYCELPLKHIMIKVVVVVSIHRGQRFHFLGGWRDFGGGQCRTAAAAVAKKKKKLPNLGVCKKKKLNRVVFLGKFKIVQLWP